MPSLSEILKSKSESNQQRTATRRAERENLSAMRDEALTAITSTPDLYEKFLTLQGDNIGLSAGNVALALFQLVEPTKIGTTEYWHEQNRYVVDEEIQNGAKVFVPPRNPSYRGYFMGNYYDISQTGGKPVKESVPLTENPGKMEAVFAALLDTAPVGFTENLELDTPVRYNEAQCRLEINTEQPTEKVIAALATEISYARSHERGRNRDYDRANFQLSAESVGYMVCRRIGVDCPMPNAQDIDQFYSYYTADERGRALELMRQAAKNMGDTIERSIQPRQQEYNNSRNNTRRQYGAR
jgi:hypothetical protein